MPYNISIGLYVGIPRVSTLSAAVGDVLRIFGLSIDQMRSSTVQWKRDGSNISGATSDTYTVTSADQGTSITAVVTLADTSELTTSPGASISGTPVVETELTTFGADIPASYTVTSDFAGRKLGFLGDSRIAGTRSNTTPGEIIANSGLWLWAEDDSNKGVSGSTINDMRTSQIPALLADGIKNVCIITGTNGAGSGTDTFADRQSELLASLALLDQTGMTIFLSDEIPGRLTAAGSGTDAVKVADHAWRKTLTAASAGLTNAELIIVPTWAAVADNDAEDITTEIEADWTGDGLHPSNHGSSRIAKAFFDAFETKFGTDLLFDIDNPALNLLDGTTTVNPARGTVPSGMNDFSAADELTYATAGTGLATVLTAANSHVTDHKDMAMRVNYTPTGTLASDAYLWLQWEIDHDPDADTAVGNQNYCYEIQPDNYDFGAGGSSYSNTKFFEDDATAIRNQDLQVGGTRSACIRLGETGGANRIQILFRVPESAEIRITGMRLFE